MNMITSDSVEDFVRYLGGSLVFGESVGIV